MRSLLIRLLFCLASATAAIAQSLPEGMEEIGRFNVVIGEVPESFIAAHIPAMGKSYVTARESAGFRILNVAGGSLEKDSRLISILIGPFTGNLPETASFELYDGPSVLAANVDTGLRVTLSNSTLGEDGTLEFHFEGKAVPAERTSDGVMVPIDGASPVSVSGTFSGFIPAAE